MYLIISLSFGLVYFLIGISLFILNFMAFRKFSGLDVDKEIIEDHNNALASIIRGQLVGQAVMIASLIYFLGTNIESISHKGVLQINNFLYNIADLFVFGLLGIFIFQMTIFAVSKIIPLHKEIMIDQNESLGKIIEGLIIAIAVILSFSIYSY